MAKRDRGAASNPKKITRATRSGSEKKAAPAKPRPPKRHPILDFFDIGKRSERIAREIIKAQRGS